MENENVIIRGYRREDQHRVREICRKGGQRGNPISTYIEDEELVLNLIADYFIDREPESCLVAEVEGKVVGYVLGSENITKYLKFVAIVILPRLFGARVLEARKATLWDHCTNKQWEFKLLAKDL